MLTLRYRPAKFADLVGQNAARAVLQALVFGEDMPPALLFGGTSGTGKTTAARIVAAALNCSEPVNGDCCGDCASCLSVQAGASFSVHEIDAATNGGVDEIRALKELATFSTGGNWRIILLDEAHAMSRQAFNALLKVLEEPPPLTLFILLTTEPDKIMPTVRSRTMPIDFRPVAPQAILSRLQTICEAEKISMPLDVLTEIAVSSDGGLRNAVMLLDQAARIHVQSLESLRVLTGRSDIPKRILSAVVAQDHPAARTLVEQYFLTSGDVSDLVTEMLADLHFRFQNHSITYPQMVEGTKLLWSGRTIPRSPSRTARIQAEALVFMLYSLFHSEAPFKVAAEKVDTDSEKSLESDSLDDLAAMT